MIESYSFGRMAINGRTYSDDVKIISGLVTGDWWRAQGHLLQPADITDILAAKPRTLVIGTGNSGRMRIAPETERAIAEAGVRLIAEPTTRAWRTFNAELAEDPDTAGAFHLTC